MSNIAFELPQPQVGEHGPYGLVGTARAKPGQAQALQARLLELVEPTRREDGALQYHVHRDRADPDLFVFYEVWRDPDALRVHLEQPYIRAFLADRDRYLAGDMEVRWLRMSSTY